MKSTVYQLSPTTQLEVLQGDLTSQEVDAIVNAANDHLAHGAGVAAAIAKAGGPVVQQESDAWVARHGPVSHAEPAYTSAGKLPASYVIHAVGPIWGSGDEHRKLAAAIRGSLERAAALGLTSIAFPAISAGIFGFPKEQVAQVFMQTFADYFRDRPESPLHLVRLVLWSEVELSVFEQATRQMLAVD